MIHGPSLSTLLINPKLYAKEEDENGDGRGLELPIVQGVAAAIAGNTDRCLQSDAKPLL